MNVVHVESPVGPSSSLSNRTRNSEAWRNYTDDTGEAESGRREFSHWEGQGTAFHQMAEELHHQSPNAKSTHRNKVEVFTSSLPDTAARVLRSEQVRREKQENLATSRTATTTKISSHSTTVHMSSSRMGISGSVTAFPVEMPELLDHSPQKEKGHLGRQGSRRPPSKPSIRNSPNFGHSPSATAPNGSFDHDIQHDKHIRVVKLDSANFNYNRPSSPSPQTTDSRTSSGNVRRTRSSAQDRVTVRVGERSGGGGGGGGGRWNEAEEEREDSIRRRTTTRKTFHAEGHDSSRNESNAVFIQGPTTRIVENGSRDSPPPLTRYRDPNTVDWDALDKRRRTVSPQPHESGVTRIQLRHVQTGRTSPEYQESPTWIDQKRPMDWQHVEKFQRPASPQSPPWMQEVKLRHVPIPDFKEHHGNMDEPDFVHDVEDFNPVSLKKTDSSKHPAFNTRLWRDLERPMTSRPFERTQSLPTLAGLGTTSDDEDEEIAQVEDSHIDWDSLDQKDWSSSDSFIPWATEVHLRRTPSLPRLEHETFRLPPVELRGTPSQQRSEAESFHFPEVELRRTPSSLRLQPESFRLSSVELRRTPSLPRLPPDQFQLPQVELRRTPSLPRLDADHFRLMDVELRRTPSLPRLDPEPFTLPEYSLRRTPSLPRLEPESFRLSQVDLRRVPSLPRLEPEHFRLPEVVLRKVGVWAKAENKSSKYGISETEMELLDDEDHDRTSPQPEWVRQAVAFGERARSWELLAEEERDRESPKPEWIMQAVAVGERARGWEQTNGQESDSEGEQAVPWRELQLRRTIHTSRLQSDSDGSISPPLSKPETEASSPPWLSEVRLRPTPGVPTIGQKNGQGVEEDRTPSPPILVREQRSLNGFATRNKKRIQWADTLEREIEERVPPPPPPMARGCGTEKLNAAPSMSRPKIEPALLQGVKLKKASHLTRVSGGLKGRVQPDVESGINEDAEYIPGYVTPARQIRSIGTSPSVDSKEQPIPTRIVSSRSPSSGHGSTSSSFESREDPAKPPTFAGQPKQQSFNARRSAPAPSHSPQRPTTLYESRAGSSPSREDAQSSLKSSYQSFSSSKPMYKKEDVKYRSTSFSSESRRTQESISVEDVLASVRLIRQASLSTPDLLKSIKSSPDSPKYQQREEYPTRSTATPSPSYQLPQKPKEATSPRSTVYIPGQFPASEIPEWILDLKRKKQQRLSSDNSSSTNVIMSNVFSVPRPSSPPFTATPKDTAIHPTSTYRTASLPRSVATPATSPRHDFSSVIAQIKTMNKDDVLANVKNVKRYAASKGEQLSTSQVKVSSSSKSQSDSSSSIRTQSTVSDVTSSTSKKFELSTSPAGVQKTPPKFQSRISSNSPSPTRARSASPPAAKPKSSATPTHRTQSMYSASRHRVQEQSQTTVSTSSSRDAVTSDRNSRASVSSGRFTKLLADLAAHRSDSDRSRTPSPELPFQAAKTVHFSADTRQNGKKPSPVQLQSPKHKVRFASTETVWSLDSVSSSAPSPTPGASSTSSTVFAGRRSPSPSLTPTPPHSPPLNRQSPEWNPKSPPQEKHLVEPRSAGHGAVSLGPVTGQDNATQGPGIAGEVSKKARMTRNSISSAHKQATRRPQHRPTTKPDAKKSLKITPNRSPDKKSPKGSGGNTSRASPTGPSLTTASAGTSSSSNIRQHKP